MRTSESRDKSSDSFSEGDTHVSVTRPKGFLLRVEVIAKVDLPPQHVFNILTNPRNDGTFRNVKGTTFRKVLRKEGHLQQIEVEQVTGWKFLCFRGSFSTRLFVEQNSKDLTVSFKLARKGMMKDFEGSWTLQPFCKKSYDEAVKGASSRQICQPEERRGFHVRALDLGSLMHPRLHLPNIFGSTRSYPQATLAILSQSVAPAYAPPPLDRLLIGISIRTIRTVLEDLKAEADRINATEQRSS